MADEIGCYRAVADRQLAEISSKLLERLVTSLIFTVKLTTGAN
jgi:hypothetical protein